MGAPPVEVYCKSVDSKSNEIIVETEVYADGYANGVTYYINTRWDKERLSICSFLVAWS